MGLEPLFPADHELVATLVPPEPVAAIGVRRDGQKVLLSIGGMGGESQAAWRQFLDDIDRAA